MTARFSSAVLGGYVVTLWLVAGLTGCNSNDFPPVAGQNAKEVAGTRPEPVASPRAESEWNDSQLRVRNYGPAPVAGLVVIFPRAGAGQAPGEPDQYQRIRFGYVPVGATTEYRSVPVRVFPFAAFEYQRAGHRRTQPVTDFATSSLPSGAYTYSLTVETFPDGRLHISLTGVTRDR